MIQGPAKITRAHQPAPLHERLADEVDAALAAFGHAISPSELAQIRAVLAEQLRAEPVVRLLVAAREGRTLADADTDSTT